MTRRWRWIGGLLLGCWLAGLAGLTEAADAELVERVRERLAAGVLRWGGDAEGGAPYQLRDPHDPARVIGFEVDIADALAESLGRLLDRPFRAEFTQYEWVSLVPGLEKRDFDVILAGLEVNDETRQQVHFSRPYYVYGQQLAVRLDETRIASLDDCRGRPVATLSGTAAERLLRTIGAQVVGFDGQVEPYLDLEFGRVDAVLLDTPIHVFYGATNPKLKGVGPVTGHGHYAIGLRPEDRELAQVIDEALGDLIASGKLRDILRRWHLWNADQAGLVHESRRDHELPGLGFRPDRTPLGPDELPLIEPVDRNMLAASAHSWTFDRYAPLLIRAAGMTILLTLASMSLAVLLGLFVAICRLYGPAPIRWLALAYVEVFRGVPLLLVLFFIYYGLASWGFQLPATVAAIYGFGLTYAAYESEIYRSSIEGVPRGQWEAARALGMSEPLAFRRVILPQALRTALGPMTNDFVALFKDTSLVSVIAVRELTKEYLVLARSSLMFVELGLVTAALYLIMSVPLGYLSRYLEQRWGPKR